MFFFLFSEQRYDNPSRQNRGFYGNESFNGSDEYNSLEGRRYAVGQALDRLRGTDAQVQTVSLSMCLYTSQIISLFNMVFIM